MKQNTILMSVVCLLMIFTANNSVYLTKDAVGNALTTSPLQFGNGNIPGTHEKFIEYSIDNLIFKPGVKDKLNGVRDSIVSGSRDEDDESFVNALTHFYSPLLPEAQGCLFAGPSCVNAKELARGYYKYAQKLYQDNPSRAWYKIGRALHLLQDMAAPAHVHRSSHLQHANIWKNGYEWWVARFWDYDSSITGEKYEGFMLKPYLDKLKGGNPYFTRPIEAGTMDGFMDAMAVQAYFGYEWDYAPLFDPTPLFGFNGPHVVGDEEAQHTASVLVPSAILIGGGLLQ
jgi:hypothetical protein